MRRSLHIQSFCCWPVMISMLLIPPVQADGQEERPTADAPTVLGKSLDHFTLNGKPTFLCGISYYGALGASPDTVRRDLDDLREFGFNWIRVWVTWESDGENVSALDSTGNRRAPYLGRLKSLVAACDQRNMVVDVTLARSRPARQSFTSVHLPDLQAHKQAIRTVIGALRPHRNWYLDLANERDVRDSRYVPIGELKQLRQLARDLDPQLLVTASFGGHDLSDSDIRDVLVGFQGDFLAIHRPRHAGSPRQTQARTREVLAKLEELQRVCPVHHQEPFRRGYASWEPDAEDFLTDVRGALNGGAAGWCFHNGSTRTAADQKPRRSFDLRQQRLIEQLDAEEQKVLRNIRDILTESDTRKN